MSGLYRILGKIEQQEFRDSARKNYNPNLDDTIKDIWHPVYRHECLLILSEYINEVLIPHLANSIYETTCNSEESPEE